MTDDKEPRLRRLEDAIEAFLDHDQTKSGEDLLAAHEDLADLIRPMLDHAADDADPAAAAGDATVVLPGDQAEDLPAGGPDDRPSAQIGDRADATREPGSMPERIADLSFVREIGRGGMGIVYEAEDRLLKRRVAVKLMLRSAGLSASAIVRFRREAELAASLSHPSIVPVHALGESGQEFYLSMGLVPSASLADVLSLMRRVLAPAGDPDSLRGEDLSQMDFGRTVAKAVHGRFPDAEIRPSSYERHERAIAEALRQVADALGHAHTKGIIHRDVKPANVLLDGAGKAYLTDFGLACVQDDPRVTQPGATPGTPQYMAPEQINDERGELSPATDVFALGVTLYEALTLRRAFPGETLPAVLFAVTSRDPIDPLTHNPTISKDLVAIMQRALHKDPADRYPTANEFAADLAAFLRGDAVSVRPLPWSSRVARKAKREPWQVAVVLLLLVGVPLVVGLWMASDTNESQSKVGEQVLLDKWIDQQLSDGFREAGEGNLDAARACFAAILAKDAQSEVGIAGMSVLARRNGDRAALAVLDEHALAVADSPALLRRRATLLHRLEDPAAEQAARGLPTDFVDFDAFLAGYALLELGHEGENDQYAAARRMLHRACVTADRPRPVYYYEWLHAAAHDRDAEDAASAIAAVERLWPDDPTARFWVSFAHTLLGKRDEAVEALRAALAANPKFQQAALNLSALLQRMGRADEAERVLREALSGAPRPAELWSQIGKMLVAQRKVPAALEALARAVEQYPEHLALRANYASTLILKQDFAEAEKQMRFVLERQPDEPGVLYSIGSLQLKRGDAKGARKNLEASARIRPLASTYYQLGLCCSALRDLEGAKQAYESCLEIDEHHAEALTNLANHMVRERNMERAEQLLRRAVQAKPKLLPARRTLLRVLDRSAVAAVEMCRDWAEHMPDSAEPLRYLAASMVKSGDEKLLPEAMQAAKTANDRMQSKDGPTMHVLGQVQLWSGDAKAARATVQKAMSLLPASDRFTPYYRQQMAATLQQCDRALGGAGGK